MIPFLAPRGILPAVKVVAIAVAVIAVVAWMLVTRGDARRSAALEVELREVARVNEVNRATAARAATAAAVAADAELEAQSALEAHAREIAALRRSIDAAPKSEGQTTCDLSCTLPPPSPLPDVRAPPSSPSL